MLISSFGFLSFPVLFIKDLEFLQDWTKKVLSDWDFTGYSWWDQCNIYFMKSKWHNWLPFDLRKTETIWRTKCVNPMPISRPIWFSWMNYASISLKITCNNNLYSKLFMELFKHHFFFIAKINTRPASIAVVVKCF